MVSETGEDDVGRSFAALMADAGPFEKSPLIAVALSGGADSLALIYLADQWARAQGGRAIALTVDHGLRDESVIEAQMVQGWMKEAAIEHHILRWDTAKLSSNIQAKARDARYRLLSHWCVQHSILHLLTAHHLDDQAETLLLRLQRGSGVDGLSAMPLITSSHGIRILRPLLHTPKAALQQFLRNLSQTWVEDPSNSNPHYLRSHIRHFLKAPFGSNVMDPVLFAGRLAASAEHMGRARASLERVAARTMLEVVDIFPEGYCQLKREAFNQLAEEEAYSVLAAVLITVSGNYYKPRFTELLRLYNAIKAPAAFKACTLWGCYIFVKHDVLVISREPAAVEKALLLQEGESRLWDNRFHVSGGQGEMRVEALGEAGFQAIKIHYPKVFLPKTIIITLPAFKTLESLIAVPHINFYSDVMKKNQVSAYFTPASPLAARIFHHTRSTLTPNKGSK